MEDSTALRLSLASLEHERNELLAAVAALTDRVRLLLVENNGLVSENWELRSSLRELNTLLGLAAAADAAAAAAPAGAQLLAGGSGGLAQLLPAGLPAVGCVQQLASSGPGSSGHAPLPSGFPQ